MRIDLHPDLLPTGADMVRYAPKMGEIVERAVPKERRGQRDRRTGVVTGATEVILTSSVEAGASMFHANYAEYLSQCYARHMGYVITPDVVWHTVLSEIAAVVVAAPDTYAGLFTSTPGTKRDIVVLTDDVAVLPLDAIVDGLKGYVPTDVDAFLPTFTTDDAMARLAQQAAFAEACSPYYSYFSTLCGFRWVDVRGERSDYETIRARLDVLATTFDGLGTEIVPYLRKVIRLMDGFLGALDARDVRFFDDVLRNAECHSGHFMSLKGW